MKTRDLHIAEPCHESWDAMHGDEARRFCDSCTKHVHHLSGMTRREAESLLRAPRTDGNLCVRYAHDERGEVRFRSRRVRATAPLAQLRGAAELVATASAVAAVFAGCGWPSAFAQELEPMGELPVQVDLDSPVMGQEAAFMGAPFAVEPDDQADGEGAEGSGDGAWGPVTDQPLMGDIAAPEPCDPQIVDDLGEATETGAISDVHALPPVMGRMPYVPSEAIYEQEQQAAEVLGAYGIALEEEELVEDEDGETDATVTVPVLSPPDSRYLEVQGGMPPPEMLLPQ